MNNVNIAVCGAGIAGIATAYYLATQHRQDRIILIDKQLPMSLTTSKSGENFRELWPQACMTALMGRSLSLMQTLADEYADIFNIRYSGYDFVSQFNEREVLPAWELPDTEDVPAVTWWSDQAEIKANRPYIADTIRQVVHMKRAGAIDVQALGQLMLSQAKRAGLTFCNGTIRSIDRTTRSGFRLDLEANGRSSQVYADQLVLAAGPFVGHLVSMLGIELPMQNILQRKIIIPDPAAIIPRDMPFTIFADSQHLNWNDEEKELFAADPAYRWLLDEFPAGLHIKPEAKGQIKLGWAYNRTSETPSWEVANDFDFPNVVVRGASRFIPALDRYVDKLPTPVAQFAGYYTRTKENWPIIGPLDDKLYAVAALSGYGTMAACGAGELCADWVTGETGQPYARHFHPDRYSDPAIKAEIDSLASDGQL